MSPAVPDARSVALQTPSRLHLGIFSLPEGGYGGVGLAIDRPRVRLRVTAADHWTASGPQSDRALQPARLLAARLGIRTGAAIDVEEAITPHVGLGSGTQIALAALTGVTRLWQLDLPLEELAGLAGRAARSRIGLEAFRRGGFVAHSTWQSGETATRLRRFPSRWRFVVAAPAQSSGLSGEAESQAFAELAPMRLSTQREVRRIVEEEILPGVEKADIQAVGWGLNGLQAIVGDFFAPVQGGRYAHPLGEALVKAMLQAGATGAGQSSWGPAICGLFGDEEQAEQARQQVAARFAGVLVWVTGADNHGTQEWELR